MCVCANGETRTSTSGDTSSPASSSFWMSFPIRTVFQHGVGEPKGADLIHDFGVVSRVEGLLIFRQRAAVAEERLNEKPQNSEPTKAKVSSWLPN